MFGGHDVTSTIGQVGNEIGGPARPRSASQASTKASRPNSASTSVDRGVIGLGRGRAEGERDSAPARLEQPVAAPRLAVIVALGRGAGDDLDLAIVEAEAPVDRGDLRLDRPLVGQEDAGRAALDDGGRDGAAIDVGERLGGEDDGGVLLAQRLQPLAQLRGEAAIVEREPALVDDEQRRPAIEAPFDAMEEIGEHGAGAAPVPIRPSVSKAWTDASPSRSVSASSSRP